MPITLLFYVNIPNVLHYAISFFKNTIQNCILLFIFISGNQVLIILKVSQLHHLLYSDKSQFPLALETPTDTGDTLTHYSVQITELIILCMSRHPCEDVICTYQFYDKKIQTKLSDKTLLQHLYTFITFYIIIFLLNCHFHNY